MSLVSFALVILGENFPVTSLDLGDFEFRHRALRETLRLPMILQAETETARLQVLPERFEVSVTRPDRVDIQSEGLIVMAHGLFQYVGPKAVAAIGHNAIYRLDGSAEYGQSQLNSLVAIDSVERVLESRTPISSQQQYFFRRGQETQGRVNLGLTESGEVALDFNFHYDLKAEDSSVTARAAISGLAESLAMADSMVAGFRELFEAVRA